MRPVGGAHGPAFPADEGGNSPIVDPGGWAWEPTAARTALEQRGFDVADDDMVPGRGLVGSLEARRERGTSVWVVVVDAGGRLRAEMTSVRGERAGGEEVAGVALRLVVEERRTATITGTLAASGQLETILDALDHLAGGSDSGDDRG